MSAAPAPPGALRDTEGLPGDWDRWLADDALNDVLPGDPGLADDAWLADDPLTEGPHLADDAWVDDDPDWADGPGPVVREVLKAGFWDRSAGDGGGFAAGGVIDRLPPGATLAGLAGDAWDDGLERLSDDELIGVLRAARRLTSWTTAMELAAVADLWRRRTAEEDAGDTGVACHADDEIAAALTLTSRAAERVLGLAVALRRLPATGAALAAGDIDPPRAAVVADEVTGLGDAHAAAVDRAVAAAAPGQTTGQLRAATRRAVLAADPSAARRRKEEALREARVEWWDEPAGTAALAGRDLPPASVLAADQHLTTLAGQLKAAGVPGTMDNLRAHVYLALLSGIPVSALLPAEVGAPAAPGSESPQATAKPGLPPRFGGLATRGSVHLTLPLATGLGEGDTPGQVAGFGPVDGTGARDLAAALAAHRGTTWCLTLTGRDGRPVAHGCAHTSPRRSRIRARGQPRVRPGRATRDRPEPGSRDGPRASPGGRTWTFTMTVLDGDGCDHAWETPAYQPTDRLRHLVQIRHATCTFPGCRRPAAQCDQDHTVAYDDGGPTCLCNLAGLCRHHHQVKQTPGWALEQTTPGVLTWTTPAGRRYTTTPTEYPR